MLAEDAYLFRHALLRDAAYQLQLPGERARLHRAALETIERLFGGRPPEPPPLDVPDGPGVRDHPADALAGDLARHAEQGEASPGIRALYLRRAAEWAHRSWREGEAQSAWERLAGLLGGIPRAEALRNAAHCANRRGLWRRAEELVREAMTCAGDENRPWTAAALEVLASIQSGSSRSSEAVESYDRAIAIFREVRDRKREARGRAGLATVFRHTGRFQEAEKEIALALAGHRETGDRDTEGSTLALLAGVYYDTGRRDLAERTFESALAIEQAMGDDRGAGIVLGNLGALYSDSGRLAEAREAFERAMAIHRRVGNLRSEGIMLVNLGGLLRKEGRLEQGERCLLRALEIHREVGNLRSEGVALQNLAELYESAGRHEEAGQAAREALVLHRQAANPRFEGISLSTLSLLAASRGRAEEASGWRTQALEVFGRTGNRDLAGVLWCRSAGALAAAGLRDEAVEAWRTGEGILVELGDTAELAEQARAMRAACRKAGFPPLDGPQGIIAS